MGYDRYNRYRTDGKIFVPPMIRIEPKSTDFFETYHRGMSRLDLISFDYYGDPGYDWLILMANPELGNLEFEIPDGATLRIPYPLGSTLENYSHQIDRYITLYGINGK